VLTLKQKYDQVFIENLSVEASQLADDVAYNQVPAWDSIGHMTMVAALETTFNFAMETDDIVNFSSYKKGFEIMKKYGIQLES